MPTYEYKCTECDEHFEIQQSIKDDTLKTLAGDDHEHLLKKVFHPVGIAFKGDGFYKNDARSSSKSSKKPTKASSDSASSSDASKSSDSASGSSSDSATSNKSTSSDSGSSNSSTSSSSPSDKSSAKKSSD